MEKLFGMFCIAKVLLGMYHDDFGAHDGGNFHGTDDLTENFLILFLFSATCGAWCVGLIAGDAQLIGMLSELLGVFEIIVLVKRTIRIVHMGGQGYVKGIKTGIF